mgnify:CR=1 FL=1
MEFLLFLSVSLRLSVVGYSFYMQNEDQRRNNEGSALRCPRTRRTRVKYFASQRTKNINDFARDSTLFFCPKHREQFQKNVPFVTTFNPLLITPLTRVFLENYRYVLYLWRNEISPRSSKLREKLRSLFLSQFYSPLSRRTKAISPFFPSFPRSRIVYEILFLPGPPVSLSRRREENLCAVSLYIPVITPPQRSYFKRRFN